MSSPNDQLREKVKMLPSKPGVYQYYDKSGELIYVGKAKNLKNRVSSYFVKQHDYSFKTKKLVSQITDLKYTIVNSEYDALLLENALIKENQPKYNIQLKDGKSYPYIAIYKERFPRLEIVRNINKKEAELFGPFTSVRAINAITEFIKKLYPIRNCHYNLSQENIDAKKYKVCMEYHIGNCLGPCEGLQKESEYDDNIASAKEIIKGRVHLVRDYLKNEMNALASKYEYEKANALKEKIETLERFQTKSQVVNPKLDSLEVFSIVSDQNNAFVNHLIISNGTIISSRNIKVKKKLNEPESEILTHIIINHNRTAKEVLVNIPIKLTDIPFGLTVPKIGDKKKLINLSLKNARQLQLDSLNKKSGDRENIALAELKENLNLQKLPMHIECFDNSNIQGSNPVASMVCFKNGKPAKKEYRHYNIKTVVGPDDFGSMKEIVGRRYKRVLEEGKPLPDLIVIDGGKGQLNAAIEALIELNLYGQTPIIGLAKRIEEIFFPNDQEAKLLGKRSQGLLLLQHIRNEAHRFAITFHREKRSKGFISNELEQIPGIGEKTAQLLLKKYKSVNKLKAIPKEELSQLVGQKKAETLLKYIK